jgi:hypothetical protein
LQTLHVQLTAGREFDQRDSIGSMRTAIVNAAFARKFLNGKNPIGARIRREATPRDPEIVYEIVGLVGDTKYADMREEFLPIVYMAAGQEPIMRSDASILIRSSEPLPRLAVSVRAALGKFNPQISFAFSVFRNQIRNSLLPERLMATLSGYFGILATLLATIGLYGVDGIFGCILNRSDRASRDLVRSQPASRGTRLQARPGSGTAGGVRLRDLNR